MSGDERRERRLALAALALDEAPTAPGAPPELDELAAWMAGEIAPERARQIRAHVARDPQTYEAWRQLRLAVAEDTPARTRASSTVARAVSGSASDGRADASAGWLDTLRDRFGYPALGGGFATIAALGIAIGVSLGPPPPDADIWQDWQRPKGVGSAAIAERELAELQSFLAGVAEQTSALGLPPLGPNGHPLPRRAPPCDGADTDCRARRERLIELGRLSVLSRWECVLESAVPDRRDRATELLAALESDPGAARLLGPLRDWASADSQRARCGAVDRLLARALSAQRASSPP